MMNIFKDMLSGKRPMPKMSWKDGSGMQPTEDLSSQFNTSFNDALTNNTSKQPEQLGQQAPQLPRHSGVQNVAPSSMSQSLDNVNTNKGARRNVASDDWFHIDSKPNTQNFF